jgi:hypothetical protein
MKRIFRKPTIPHRAGLLTLPATVPAPTGYGDMLAALCADHSGPTHGSYLRRFAAAPGVGPWSTCWGR